MSSKKLTRRNLLRSMVIGGAGLGLAACTPTVVEKVVQQTVVVKETVVVQETVVVAGTPQVVEKSKVVEKVVTATPAAAAAPPEIKFNAPLDPGELEPLVAACDAYNKEYNTHIVFEEFPWDAYSQKVVTMVAGGAAPDITFMHSSWVSLWADQDAILSLDPFIDADPSLHFEDFFPEVAKYHTYRGVHWGLPTTSWPYVTYFNKTLFDKLGVPDPSTFMEGLEDDTDEWTWEKMVEVALPLSTGEGATRTFGAMRSYGCAPKNMAHTCAYVYSAGGEMFNEDASQVRICEPATLEAIQFQIDLINKYNVVPQAGQADGIPQGWNSGQYGMWLTNRSELPGFENVDFELGMAPYPRSKKRVTRDAPSAYAILSTSKVADAAYKFLAWMASPQPGVLGGQDWRLTEHFAIPTRYSNFNSPVFLDSMLDWESRRVYQDSASKVRAMPMWYRFSEVNSAYGEQWDRAVLGEATVEEAMDQFCTKANELLST